MDAMKPTKLQKKMEAAVDAVLDAHDYELDLEVAASMVAETTGFDSAELVKAYCVVNEIGVE